MSKANENEITLIALETERSGRRVTANWARDDKTAVIRIERVESAEDFTTLFNAAFGPPGGAAAPAPAPATPIAPTGPVTVGVQPSGPGGSNLQLVPPPPAPSAPPAPPLQPSGPATVLPVDRAYARATTLLQVVQEIVKNGARTEAAVLREARRIRAVGLCKVVVDVPEEEFESRINVLALTCGAE